VLGGIGIGTGDLTGLAATALALIGEWPWLTADGRLTRALLPPAVADADALAFLSSNAVTLAGAALGHQDLAALLDAAAPASLGTAVLSRGAEEHAAFSPQAARAAAAMVAPLRTLLACALVAAVRGLRQRADSPSGDRLRAVYDRCLQRLPADDEDHPLDVDVDVDAEQVIADLAQERADVGGRRSWRVAGADGPPSRRAFRGSAMTVSARPGGSPCRSTWSRGSRC
jgi:histidine ammonia-lyase